jgi:hypothetical protein
MGKLSVNSSIHTVAADRALNEDTYKNKRSRSGALTSSLVHIIPVGVTFGILQLSFRNVYWADADAQNQRQKLSALQIAAKVHEIFILVSLSSMVLHYTRKLMVAPAGISFGLLEAAYQSGLSSNPWTIGNWEALKHLRQNPRMASGDLFARVCLSRAVHRSGFCHHIDPATWMVASTGFFRANANYRLLHRSFFLGLCADRYLSWGC